MCSNYGMCASFYSSSSSDSSNFGPEEMTVISAGGKTRVFSGEFLIDCTCHTEQNLDIHVSNLYCCSKGIRLFSNRTC